MASYSSINVLSRDATSQIGSACKRLLVDSGLPLAPFFEDEKLKKAVSDFASQNGIPVDPKPSQRQGLHCAYLYAAVRAIATPGIRPI